jgi:histidinol-phosphate aminotransferase
MTWQQAASCHGGADLLGQPEADFSTNANACGPCPLALQALAQADARYYPEPSYTALRQHIADFHGVAAERIALAASGSEFIQRITALVALQSTGVQAKVWLPHHAYGDYARAAAAHGLARAATPGQADLVWCCEPSSPLGAADECLPLAPSLRSAVVLDRAYEPLRLTGVPSLPAAALANVWQLWTPNKALGLPGVRAAYAIAPLNSAAIVRQLNDLAASWLLGAHGVALLEAWLTVPVQTWVQESLHTLREWKAQQIAVCSALGFDCLPSEANFYTARLPGSENAEQAQQRLQRLRRLGVKLRDASSFGLPGHARLSVQSPATQQALRSAWEASA